MPNSGSIYKPLYISEYNQTGIPSAKPAHTVIPLKKWHKNLNTLASNAPKASPTA